MVNIHIMIMQKEYKRKRTAVLLFFFVFLLFAVFHKWQIYAASKYLSAGEKEFAQSNYSSALKNFNYAASLDGERNIIYLAKIKKGEIFYRYGQFDKARGELLGALKEKNDDFRAYDMLGDIFSSENEFNEAIRYYDRAIQFSREKETEAEIRLKRAKSFMFLGELDAASGILSALSIENNDTGNGELSYYLGLLDFNVNYSLNDNLNKLESDADFGWKIDRIKNFIKEYDQESNMDYNNVKIADLYNQINEPWLAINRMKKVTKDNDLYRDAWIILGESEFIAGQYADSLSSFHKALALDERDGEIYYWLKNVYERIGNQKKADEYSSKYDKLK